MRKFKSGATRDDDKQKLNYIGSFSPLALRRFAEFMRDHNIKNGDLKRNEGNWKKGMPKQSYIESKIRHFVDFWITHEGYEDGNIEDMLCADIFNAMGYLHELLVAKLPSIKLKKKKQKNPKKKFAKPIKVKFYTKKIIHYWPKNRKKAICGLKKSKYGTESKKKPTCKTCLKIIKCWE